ncbi:MAG: TAXI family TRAP transporter solute-binding subunit [Spirochaetia bacterium]|jgi:TRAP transporter TAXI family solute receptor|nr:TAXI family TRAP transporter solute-binding subunit [Spirochaetia bacterium]
MRTISGRKKVLAILFAGLFVAGFAFAGGGGEAAAPAPAASASGGIPVPSSPLKYSMAGGSVGGNFYLMGGGLAQTINKHLPQYFLVTSETTGGGSANAGMIQNGEAEFGIVMTSSLFEAQQGEAKWTNGVKHTKLRGAAALYPSWLTIYTLSSSGIKKFQDINGRIIGLGSKGMAMDSIFRQYLESQKVVPKQIHNDGHGATATALGNGIIDVALLFSYPPFAAIAELESTKDLSFVPLSAQEQKALTDKYSFYVADAMPAGSYKGATQNVPGVSEWNMMVTSSDVPADMVYLVVKALFENQADMIAVHPSAKFMTAKNNLNFNVPLHAGVIRYMKEVGIDVPARLIPPEYKD